MTPRRPMFVVAFAAVSLLAVAGCTATQTSASAVDPGSGTDTETAQQPVDAPDQASSGGEEFAAPAIETLVMIGDSITVASADAVEERFATLGLSDILIEAQSGKRIAQDDRGNSSGTTIARGLVQESAAGATDPSAAVWVIALGTNDVNQYADQAEIAAVVDELLAEVPATATVVWVDTYHANDPTASDLVNEVIAARLAARGNAVIAQWSDVAEYDGVLRIDGIHPSATGVEVFAATVAAAVADVLGS